MKNFLSELRLEIRTWPVGQRMILYSVFISISGGRWASYIGLPSQNIFLIDVLFFGGWLLSISRFAQKASFHRILYHLSLVSFLIFEFLRNSDLSSVLKFRDLLPYVYFITFPVINFIFSSTSLRHIIMMVRLATLVHIFWLLPVLIQILKPITLGGPFGVPIFSDRWDHSGIAIAMGILAWKPNYKFKLGGNTRIQILFIVCGVFQWSRASLLAISISIIISILNFDKNLVKDIGKKPNLLLIFGYLATIFALLLPSITPFVPTNSVLNRLGATKISESLEKGASDTADARRIAQQLLLDWVARRGQLFLGVGPGKEMLLESGAYLYLSGDQKVRSPHSWLYGGICRFGYAGFTYWLLLITYSLRPSINLKRVLNPPFHFIIPILIVSLFGVIIESPFGSLPLVFFAALTCEKNLTSYTSGKKVD